jgi:NADH-quinone oxidoreductase subunit M
MTLLSFLLIVPILAGVALLLMPDSWTKAHRGTNILAAAIQIGLVVLVYRSFDLNIGTYQLIERHDWFGLPLGALGQVNIQYLLGVDGLNLALVALSSVVLLLGAIASPVHTQYSKGYHSLYLLLSAAVMGTFLALDQFLFFLCFEFMLLPMYFLIGIWGGAKRTYAAIKFFLYTLLGSVMILVVIIGLANVTLDTEATAKRYATMTGQSISTRQVQVDLLSRSLPQQYWVRTFAITDMAKAESQVPDSLLNPLTKGTIGGVDARWLAFLLLLIGFGIKLPTIPFHTWLPDAHVEAPTAISVLLAGILLKIGAYGLLRLGYGLLPEAATSLSWLVGLLGAISLVYGALVAMAQTDLKKMVAYSSVSHMGLVFLGIATGTTAGLQGAGFQLISHGLLSAGLFLAVGVLYDRTHKRDINTYQGLAKPMPYYTVLTGMLFFGSLGLPVFSGFIAELMVLNGAVEAASIGGMTWIYVGALLLTLLLTAGYFLWAFRRMFLGTFSVSDSVAAYLGNKPLTDTTKVESFLLLVTVLGSVWLGLFPNILLDIMGAADILKAH